MASEDGGSGWGGGDPRLNQQFTRTVHAAGRGVDADELGTVRLVGVVHDHPASAYRARVVVESHRPDVLALEISRIALPLFEAYAETGSDPSGGADEFTAAVAAATDARVVGIDAPSGRFLATLARKCVTGTVSPSTARDVLRSLAHVSREAAACRLAAAITSRTSATVQIGERIAHDCDPWDDPETQAADEVRQVDRVREVLAVLECPQSVRVRDETREECMARTLHGLRREGDVVAVIGVGHLEPVTAALRERAVE